MDQNSIAKMFLLVIAIIGILNAAKHYIIWQYKKKLIQPEICDYLKNIGNMAECTHQKYKDKYIMSENTMTPFILLMKSSSTIRNVLSQRTKRRKSMLLVISKYKKTYKESFHLQ